MSRHWYRGVVVAFIVGLLLLALLAVPALAQDVVYTGCLRAADGTLYSVRQGATPMAPCKAKDKQISWNMAGQPGPPGPSIPPSLNINVNCDEGQSITAALAQQAEKLTISIRGTCVESVWLRRDDVTLQGVGTNPTIMAPADAWVALDISGAQRLRVQGLALTGGGFVSLYAGEGASLFAEQLKISNPVGTGLSLVDGAAVSLRGSEIAGCRDAGAILGFGSSLTLDDSQVIDNGDIGVFVGAGVVTLRGTNVARNQFGVMVRNGRAVMEPSQSTSAPCTILDNRDQGVNLGLSQLFLDTCRIAGNSNSGIGLATGSSAVLANVIVQSNGGNIYVQQGSALTVAGASTIEGGTERPGIWLWDTSVASVSSESSITGSPYGIKCELSPAVAQLSGSVPATVTTNCPRPQ